MIGPKVISYMQDSLCSFPLREAFCCEDREGQTQSWQARVAFLQPIFVDFLILIHFYILILISVNVVSIASKTDHSQSGPLVYFNPLGPNTMQPINGPKSGHQASLLEWQLSQRYVFWGRRDTCVVSSPPSLRFAMLSHRLHKLLLLFLFFSSHFPRFIFVTGYAILSRWKYYLLRQSATLLINNNNKEHCVICFILKYSCFIQFSVTHPMLLVTAVRNSHGLREVHSTLIYWQK